MPGAGRQAPLWGLPGAHPRPVAGRPPHPRRLPRAPDDARSLACSFVAEDAGDPATVADRLVHRVLALEAHANALDVSTLMATPPGRRRRALHDDLTAVVVRLGPDGPLLSRGGAGSRGPSPATPASLWGALTSLFSPASGSPPRNSKATGG